MARSTPQKPTVIVLVRHGRTPTTGDVLPGRTPGLYLSSEGEGQARRVADYLRRGQESDQKADAASSAGITTVYASPMERTQQTAAPIAEALGLEVTIHDGLLEADFGDWTGKKLAELAKLPEWSTVQRYPSGFRFPGGESFSEMQLRIVETLQSLASRHMGETVIAVSHADPIKAAIADAIGTHLDLFQRIVIQPCSVTAIQYTRTGPLILGMNMTDPSVQTVSSS